MSEGITTFVGLDVHKESIAIAVACAGREAPRLVGTIGPSLRELLKALSHLGPAQQMLIVYEAGPGGLRVGPAAASARVWLRSRGAD